MTISTTRCAGLIALALNCFPVSVLIQTVQTTHSLLQTHYPNPPQSPFQHKRQMTVNLIHPNLETRISGQLVKMNSIIFFKSLKERKRRFPSYSTPYLRTIVIQSYKFCITAILSSVVSQTGGRLMQPHQLNN